MTEKPALIAGAASDLLLAVRQCATHSAGPLRAVQSAWWAVHCGDDIDELEQIVRAELAAMTMSSERRYTIDLFLDVVWEGLRAQKPR